MRPLQSRWPALSEPPADPGAAPQARPRKQAPGGVGLSGRVLVPPAFPRSGGELSFRKFRACAAAGVGPAVIAPAAVEQEVKAVDEKHLFVLPCLCVDHLVQVETSLCGACFSASTGSNGCVSEISRAACRPGRPARGFLLSRFGPCSGGRGPWVFRPGMLGVTAPHLGADLGVGPGPERRQVTGDS